MVKCCASDAVVASFAGRCCHNSMEIGITYAHVYVYKNDVRHRMT